MSEKRVSTNTHTMVQRLEDLRIEHMSLINSLDSTKTEKSDIILKNIKSIDVGLDEAQLMMEFTLHLQNVENEKKKLRAQIKQLSELNEDLNCKLASSHKKLQHFEKIIGEAATDEKNMASTILTSQTNDEKLLDSSSDVHFIDASDFIRVESIEMDNDSDSTITPRANHTVWVGTDESDAFSHFRTLETRASDLASKGKYEMAFLLCQQAVDNLKQTTIGRYHPYITRMMSIVSLIYGIQSKYKKATKILHAVICEKTEPLLHYSNISS